MERLDENSEQNILQFSFLAWNEHIRSFVYEIFNRNRLFRRCSAVIDINNSSDARGSRFSVE